MNKFVIAIDFDSVMNNLLENWVEELNNLYSLNKTIDDILYWDMKEVYKDELAWDQIVKPLDDPKFWLKVDAQKDSQELIKKLVDNNNFKVKVVTNSYYSILPFKFDNCLFRLFPYLSYKDIVITYDKSIIDCNILVDDYHNNFKGLRNKTYRILFDYPYNRNIDDNLYDIRLNNWIDIYDKIIEISKCDNLDYF